MKYLVDYGFSKQNHAGYKARIDVQQILSEYQILNVYDSYNKLKKAAGSISGCYRVLKKIQKDDVAIVQYPLYFWNPLDKVNFPKYISGKKIALVHDINSLRYKEQKKDFIQEIKTLNMFDIIIVHNSAMKQWLLDNGISVDIVELEIFDYIVGDDFMSSIEYPENHNYVVDFAGNLSIEKSGFLKDIKNTRNYQLHLFGSNYTLGEQHCYIGNFSPEILHKALDGHFGLIWDGNDCDTCGGNTGNYQRYNNPHKLSLYLSAGMPVIVWKEAATAKFVTENNVGFTIENLYDIEEQLENLTKEQYIQWVDNVREIAENLRNGYYTKSAVSKALECIELQ